VIEHIIDQVWNQYDYDHSGTLDETESYDFIKVVLQMNEDMLAKSMNRECKHVTPEEIKNTFKVMDVNKDGKLSKDEL